MFFLVSIAKEIFISWWAKNENKKRKIYLTCIDISLSQRTLDSLTCLYQQVIHSLWFKMYFNFLLDISNLRLGHIYRSVADFIKEVIVSEMKYIKVFYNSWYIHHFLKGL